MLAAWPVGVSKLRAKRDDEVRDEPSNRVSSLYVKSVSTEWACRKWH